MSEILNAYFTNQFFAVYIGNKKLGKGCVAMNLLANATFVYDSTRDTNFFDEEVPPYSLCGGCYLTEEIQDLSLNKQGEQLLTTIICYGCPHAFHKILCD